LIPMDPCGDPNLTVQCEAFGHPTHHFIPVATFFLINIYMTIFRFTKPSTLPVTPEKVQRNKIYVICGVIMIAAVATIFWFDHIHRSIFVPEAIAIAVFGIAWLVKGQMVLADRQSQRESH